MPKTPRMKFNMLTVYNILQPFTWINWINRTSAIRHTSYQLQLRLFSELLRPSESSTLFRILWILWIFWNFVFLYILCMSQCHNVTILLAWRNTAWSTGLSRHHIPDRTNESEESLWELRTNSSTPNTGKHSVTRFPNKSAAFIKTSYENESHGANFGHTGPALRHIHLALVH